MTTVPFDFAQETSITGFTIGGAEPTDSKRKILFEVDGKLYKFSGDNLLEVECEKTAADVLENGNTVAELLAVTDISDWCGRYVYPIIAIDAPADAAVMPSISLAAKVKSFNDIFQKSELSPVFELGRNVKFITVNFDKTVTGGATANIQVRLRQNNLWSSWLNLSDAENTICQAVQLRGNYTVTSTSGSSTAKIDDAEIIYSAYADAVTSYTSTLYLKPEDFSEDLQTCYLLVEHSVLINCDLRAFVCYDDAPLEKKEVLGIGSGASQTFLIEDGIDFDSLQVQIDGINTFDFTLNASAKTLSLTAPSGSEISVVYLYNLAPENWLEMELQYTEFDTNFNSGNWKSRFVHRLDTLENSKVIKFKIVAKVREGTKEETFTLKNSNTIVNLERFALPDSISCDKDYFYCAETNFLRVSGNVGDTCNLSYKWQGRPIEIYNVASAASV